MVFGFRFMGNKLKGPDDGKHLVLISLETEFNVT